MFANHIFYKGLISKIYKDLFITQYKKKTVFITALFIIARAWKQPRCPSADKEKEAVVYIHTMEYYSAIKKNSFLFNEMDATGANYTE